MLHRLIVAVLAGLSLTGCGAAGGPASSAAGVQVYAISGTATAVPTVAATATVAAQSPTATVISPTPTAGPVVYTLDFRTDRRDDVTLRVGQALQLQLTNGPTGDWLSGSDDARVLRPMRPDGNGVFQAVAPGSALLTAHVPFGCANVTPAVPCKNPERGLWFQTRIFVVA
jgi:hypothetical protein